MKFGKSDFATVAYTGQAGEEYQAVIEHRPVNDDDDWETLVRGRESNAFGVARSAAINLAAEYGVPYLDPKF